MSNITGRTLGVPAAHRTVSVVVTNHNYGRFLGEALDSVLSQDPPPFEVIVVDDASTDDSREVLARYSERVQVVWQPSNEGQISGYNRGFAQVKGDVVIFLDADDRLKPGAFHDILAAFAVPGVVKVHWKVDLIDVTGRATGGQVPAKLVAGDMSRLLTCQGIMYPSSPGSANAYLSDTLRQIMPLPTDSAEKHGADFYTIYGSALLGGVGIAGQGAALSEYRLHQDPDAASLSFGNAARGYRESERMQLRSEAFRNWVNRWSRQVIVIKRPMTEFSIEKNTYANGIFGQSGYWGGLQTGLHGLGPVFRTIWHRPSHVPEKLVLMALMLAILVLPRSAGWPIAKYLCDPASR